MIRPAVILSAILMLLFAVALAKWIAEIFAPLVSAMQVLP